MKFFQFLFLFLFSFAAWSDELIIEPDQGRQSILNAIATSQHDIKLVMYGFTDKTILDALIKAKQQGKNIDIILEKSPYKRQNENTRVIKYLKKYRINLRDHLPHISLIHQKTLLIDNKIAIISTFNFTKSSFKNQRNFALTIDDKEMIDEIKQQFVADWNQTFFSSHSEKLIYSPHARQKFIDHINQAKKQLIIYAQNLDDYELIGALADASKRGVSVNILTSNPLLNGQLIYLHRAGVKIHFSKYHYIHAKVIIIDHNKVILGSTNLTCASLDKNRELSLISRDKKVISELDSTFNYDLKFSEGRSRSFSRASAYEA